MATTTSPSDSAQTRTVLNLTQADSPYTLTRGQCPCLITNIGATGAVVVNLPTDCKGGEEIEAVCLAAQDLQLKPGSNGGIWASNGTTYSKQTDNKYINGDAVGEKVRLVATETNDFVASDQQAAAGAGAFSEVEA